MSALKVALDGGPYSLALGADGAMWVTLVHSGAIARVSGGGEVTVDIDLPGEPHAVVADADDGVRVALEAGHVLRMPS